MDYKDLIVYKKGFALAMEIYEITKLFPKEEKYSLIDQVRRSSRSICVNIAEDYRKRRYVKHFISKMTDADGENSETSTWLDFSFACEYISKDVQEDLLSKSNEIGKLLNYMMNNPEKFGVKIE